MLRRRCALAGETSAVTPCMLWLLEFLNNILELLSHIARLLRLSGGPGTGEGQPGSPPPTAPLRLTAGQKRWRRICLAADPWVVRREHDEAVKHRRGEVLLFQAATRDLLYLKKTEPWCCGRRRYQELKYRASTWGRLLNKLKVHPWSRDLRAREIVEREAKKRG